MRTPRGISPNRSWVAILGPLLAATLPNGCMCSNLVGPRLEPPNLPETPRPLAEVNTEFNDYNAAARYDPISLDLVFSSDRFTPDDTFDLWETHVEFEGEDVRALPPTPFAPASMPRSNEFGPLFAPSGLFFASDRAGGAGKLDIYRAVLDGDAAPGRVEPLAGLNTPANDAYLAMDSTVPFVLLASDRGGNYDLFEVRPRERIFENDAQPKRVAALSSPADDSAPFLFSHTPKPPTDRAYRGSLNPTRHVPRQSSAAPPKSMTYVVFASRRTGTNGGYDLYCSRMVDDHWQSPRPLVNLNSPSDEFRPIVASTRVAQSQVVIFSSNRPGGKGGFDLYYARFIDPFAESAP